jgi:hemolysin activation/secretion protein
MSSSTSVYSLTGDATATIHSLMAAPQEGSSDILSLSTNNYPYGDTVPNKDNQHVFMNQPLSWWVTGLNTGTIKYTPISNTVNWSFVNASGSSFYMDRSVTNIVIPNKTQSVTRDDTLKTTTIVFEPKYGLGRMDTHVF